MRTVLWVVVGYGVLLFLFLAACVVYRWTDGRKTARGDKRLLHDIQVAEPLSKEQMDELDKYVLMEELAEDAELREAGIRELELYSYWQWREKKRAA